MPTQGSLTRRVVSASGWSVLGAMGNNALRLASNLIMARLLAPEDFGLMALAIMVLTGVNMFTDFGIPLSIHRERDGDEPRFLRTAWTVSLMRGAIVAAVIVVIACLLGTFGDRVFPADSVYRAPEAPWLIGLISIAVLLQASQSTVFHVAIRRLDFRRRILVELSVQAISLVAMIGFAQVWPNVWSLFAGMMVASVLLCLASFTMFPGPGMAIVWDREITGRLWAYGKWIMVSSPFGFVATNADRLILAALLDARLFGLYAIARLWVDAGSVMLLRLTNGVGMPSLSEIARQRPQDMARAFGKLQAVTDAVCVAGFALLFTFGDAIVGVLYPDEFAEASDFLSIISLAFLTARFRTFGSLLLGVGQSRVMAIFSMQVAVAVCLGVYFGHALFGVQGAVYAVALAPLVQVPSLVWVSRPFLKGRNFLYDLVWLAGIPAVAIAMGLTL